MHDRSRELEVALDAVRIAATLCRSIQRRIGSGAAEKEDRSPVTVADYGSQALICAALEAAFPADAIVGEEDAAALRAPGGDALLQRAVDELSTLAAPLPARLARARPTADLVCELIDRGAGRVTPARFWTVDPIDGTKGFLRGDQYAVALALIEDGVPVVAALACPNLDTTSRAQPPGVLFGAIRGEGTFTAALDLPDRRTPARVSERHEPRALRLTESLEPGHTDQALAAALADRLGFGGQARRLDSMAKYGEVARGEADVYLRVPRPGYREKIWDHAAGALVVLEAGGKVTDAAGAPLDFGSGHELQTAGGIVASNGPLHGAILDAVRELQDLGL